jgi:hypothetical protein
VYVWGAKKKFSLDVFGLRQSQTSSSWFAKQ